MLRSIIALAPALAFALPLVASANPLVSSEEERWGGGGYEQVQKPHGGDSDLELMMAVCTTVQVLAQDRACEVLAYDECISACDDAIVAPNTVGACRAACADDTAAFCDLSARYYKPGKKPAKPGKKPYIPTQEPFNPDQGQVYPDQIPVGPDHSGGDKLIFVNVEQCTAIGINVQTDR